MTKTLLTQKERWYTDSMKEAEEIVIEAKEGDALTMHKIHEKHNSKGFYFLVDLERTYSTAKVEMDNRPEKDDSPEGQLSIEDTHEGIPYSVEPGGTVSVAVVEDDGDQPSEDVPF